MTSAVSKSQPATTCNSPILRANSKIFNNFNNGQTASSAGNGNNNKSGNHLSHSATSEMAHIQSVEYSSGQSTSSFPFIFQHRFVPPSPSEQTNPMSPTISSVATSVTSASEVSLISKKYDSLILILHHDTFVQYQN